MSSADFNWEDMHKAGGFGSSFHEIDELAQAHSKALDRPLTILDIGCGQGHQVQRLIELGHEVSGLDISLTAITAAKEREPGAVFICDEAKNVAKHFGPESFDFVIDRAALTCAGYSYMKATLAKVAALIRPGAIMFSCVLSKYATEYVKADVEDDGLIRKNHRGCAQLCYYLPADIERVTPVAFYIDGIGLSQLHGRDWWDIIYRKKG